MNDQGQGAPGSFILGRSPISLACM